MSDRCLSEMFVIDEGNDLQFRLREWLVSFSALKPSNQMTRVYITTVYVPFKNWKSSSTIELELQFYIESNNHHENLLACSLF